MDKISTTKKGDNFEKKVFDLFSELLDCGDFYLNSKTSKIFQKKGYYSEARKKEIIVDISIESYIGDATHYSALTIIECKSYSKSVPVDDIEEFSSKLNQIGEHNTKGIVVSHSSYQESAFNIAVSKKIGLVRINEHQSFDWVNHRKDKNSKSIETDKAKELLCSTTIQENNFIGFWNRNGFNTISQMFLYLEIIDKFNNNSKFIQLPFLSKDAIEKSINSLPTTITYDRGKLDFDILCTFLKEHYAVQFDYSAELNDQNILGKIAFKPLKISISKQLEFQSPRWRFTLAHEIGHLILHQEKLTAYLDEYTDNENSILNNLGIATIQNDRLEIQANMFASMLLMPNEYLYRYVRNYFQKENIHKDHLYLDSQPCNIRLTYNLLDELHNHFGVSTEVAKYRLIANGLLLDNQNTSLKSIMRR